MTDYKAERDAAVVAIERVKAELEALWVARREPQGPDSWYSGIVHARANVLAALDGPPEPEWEWAVSDQQFDFSPIRWLPLSGRSEAYVRELAGSRGRQVARRRKAGPWLPVEGESKP